MKTLAQQDVQRTKSVLLIGKFVLLKKSVLIGVQFWNAQTVNLEFVVIPCLRRSVFPMLIARMKPIHV